MQSERPLFSLISLHIPPLCVHTISIYYNINIIPIYTLNDYYWKPVLIQPQFVCVYHQDQQFIYIICVCGFDIVCLLSCNLLT